jgi:hypothetical protein
VSPFREELVGECELCWVETDECCEACDRPFCERHTLKIPVEGSATVFEYLCADCAKKEGKVPAPSPERQKKETGR